MKIDILTLFPNMYDGFLSESIIKRAIDNKKVDINLINFRDFTEDKHNKVDDSPYGGGRGMVLMCDPIFKAVEKVKKKNSKVILMSPQGKPYNQEMANRLSKEKHIIALLPRRISPLEFSYMFASTFLENNSIASSLYCFASK